MKLMDTSSIILFLEFISEYEFLIKFSESGEVMIITAQVEEEYNEKKDLSIQNPNYNLDKLLEKEIIIKETCEINEIFKRRYFKLGIGEKSIMSLALEYQEQGHECYCVLDDKYARDVAQKLELNVKGSIGLLVLLKEKGLLKNPNEVADKIRESPFRISDKVLEALNA